MPYKSPTLWAKDADTLGRAERLQQQRDIQPQSLLLLLYTAERYSAVVSTIVQFRTVYNKETVIDSCLLSADYNRLPTSGSQQISS